MPITEKNLDTRMKPKVSLLLFCAVTLAVVAGAASYYFFGDKKPRPASAEEAMQQLQGQWIGITVNHPYVERRRDTTMTVTELNGNSFQGKGYRSDPGGCPDFVFTGSINGNQIRPEVTFVNVPDGAMGHCRAPGHFDLEMLIGENGIPHLIGSYEFTWGGSGTMELTRAR